MCEYSSVSPFKLQEAVCLASKLEVVLYNIKSE